MKIDLKKYIRDVNDFPKDGIIFKDISPLLEAPEAFRFCIKELSQNVWDIDHIVWLDARGFIFWSAVAYELWIPFTMIRKSWKLPYFCYTKSYSLEYWENTFQMHTDSLKKWSKVAIVDDLLATWWSARAAIDLVEEAWSYVHSLHFVIELDFLEWRNNLSTSKIHSLLHY